MFITSMEVNKYSGTFLVLGSARNSDLPVSQNIADYSLVDHAIPLATPTAPSQVFEFSSCPLGGAHILGVRIREVPL